jgi:glycosyltransferase involved in cell wall biosynthesis
MRILLCSSFVPFVNGGARFIVDWTHKVLRDHGHDVESIHLPFSEEPEEILSQMVAYRLLDLSEYADRIVTFRPPAHVIPHPHKIIWFIHHIRVYYDMWDTMYRPVENGPKGWAFRDRLRDFDRHALVEAKSLFTNSRIVGDRLRTYNAIDSTPLYPPIFQPERFENLGYGDEIVCVSRVEPYKRQHLLVEAMRYTNSKVRLSLYGASQQADYPALIRELIAKYNLGDRVNFECRWISETEKEEIVGRALAVAYLPVDEDSYGYPTLEGAHARKAILTTTDSGGVLEFAIDRQNGAIADPDPRSIAEAMDELYLNRRRTEKLGAAAEGRIAELNITWPHVVESLTS